MLIAELFNLLNITFTFSDITRNCINTYDLIIQNDRHVDYTYLNTMPLLMNDPDFVSLWDALLSKIEVIGGFGKVLRIDQRSEVAFNELLL
ncbi:hypothetical protein D3C73_616590 [compost metagenome]